MTEEEKKAAEATALATAQEEERKKAELVKDDAETRIAELETEKAAILEREANYKVAYLKEVEKNKNLNTADESEEDRIRRITREEMAQSQIAKIDAEKEDLLKKTLKENKELKLAIQNKPAGASASGSSNENQVVTSTVISPEQLAAFKARGWTDKDIERYKKNLQRYK